MNRLPDRVAVVTGGAQGIGLAVCEALGAAGCHVIIADIRRERMQDAARRLSKIGLQCATINVDVTKEKAVRKMIRYTKAKFGRLDVLVSNAGVAPKVAPLIRLSTAQWKRVIDVNLLGVFLCCREAGALMVEQGGGKIINIASLNAISPPALSAEYNVAKAGVVSLTQTLALELAPFRINVNAVSPGLIETELQETVMPQRAATLGISPEQMIERLGASIPLGRWGKPSDIAKAVVFLASDQSDWITGQNIVVSGGLAGIAASPPRGLIRAGPGSTGGAQS